MSRSAVGALRVGGGQRAARGTPRESRTPCSEREASDAGERLEFTGHHRTHEGDAGEVVFDEHPEVVTFASPATATQHQLGTQDGARRKLLALRTSLAGRLVSARYLEAGVTQEDRANFAAIVAHSRVSAKLEGENPGRMNELLADSVAIGVDGHVYGLVNDDRSAASVNAFRGMSVE